MPTLRILTLCRYLPEGEHEVRPYFNRSGNPDATSHASSAAAARI
jgi:hypothetical protein